MSSHNDAAPSSHLGGVGCGGAFLNKSRLAAELVGRKVSVIVSVGGAERAAKAATATVPIVFVTGYDPVADGTVASLSRPGGNLTGVSMLTTFLETKRLGLLHDLVPKATTIAVLIDEHFPGSAIQRDQVTEAARTIGLSIHLLGASTDRELDEVFGSIAPARDQALLVPGSPLYDTRRDRIVARGRSRRGRSRQRCQ
jgi:putative tryptophan/tyrosine transport system substrate-binding protein